MPTVEFERVSAEEARKLQFEGYSIVDVRSVAEYASGHPVDAYNVPLMQHGPGGMRPNERFLEVMCALFPVDTPLLLSCQGGVRSARAAEQLLAAGFSDVVDVRPGFGGVRNAFGQVTDIGWRDAGLPVELESDGRGYLQLLGAAELADDDGPED